VEGVRPRSDASAKRKWSRKETGGWLLVLIFEGNCPNSTRLKKKERERGRLSERRPKRVPGPPKTSAARSGRGG